MISTISPTGCPSGSDWTKVQKNIHFGCYHFGSDRVSYKEAKTYCIKIGGVLAEPTNWNKQVVLSDLLLERAENGVYSGPTDDWWIGATYLDTEDIWKWESGTPWAFTQWAPGYLESTQIQNCLTMSNKYNYHWISYKCDDNRINRPICQMV